MLWPTTPAASSSGETGAARQPQECQQPRVYGVLPAGSLYSVTPPASRENTIPELPLSALMVILGSAIRTACVNRNQVWDGSHICREGCPLGSSMYLMGMLQRTMAKATGYISKSLLQCPLHRNAAGPKLASLAGGAATCSALTCSFMLLPMTSNKCRLAACLCANSSWRESVIATIVTLFCKFSLAESRDSIPTEWELCLVTSQLNSAPSVFLLLKYNVLHLIKNLHPLDSFTKILLSCFLLNSKVIDI